MKLSGHALPTNDSPKHFHQRSPSTLGVPVGVGDAWMIGCHSRAPNGWLDYTAFVLSWKHVAIIWERLVLIHSGNRNGL